MNFDPTEEQRLLAASIARFVERAYAFETRKRIVASPDGYSHDAWKTMAELGLLGLPLPVDFGGFGGGAVDTMCVMEGIGDALIVEPYLATVGLGAAFVVNAGSSAQKQRILPAIVGGTLRMAFAQTEVGARYNLAHVATRARKGDDGGYAIDGEKRVVVHGPCADLFVVSARTSGDVADPQGIGVFLVDPKAPGVSMRSYRTLDELRAADVRFDNVRVSRGALLGDDRAGLAVIEKVVDYATALVCAEAVGALKYANDATLDYLKTRKQFGVPIGAFQALQHRMVDMVIEFEQAKSMASLACAAVDADTDPASRGRAVSAAKIRIADACRHVSQEAIQLHGGMGMSDELKVSHTFRRLTMIAQQFGDADHHLERFAAV
jgi:alkylation response protein AidB-like acyl-CoA dehydrogenase